MTVSLSKLVAAAAVSFAMIGSGANAATLDLTNRNFSPMGSPETTRTFSEAGVDFTFTAINNFVGAPRLLGGDNGLQVGGGGGSSLEFTLQLSSDITLTGYGTNQGGGFALGDPIFDLTDGVTTFITNGLINDPASLNIFNTSGENTVLATGLSIALLAGTTYTFDINQDGAAVQGFFTSFDFTTNSTVIPLPAGFLLLITGLGGLGAISLVGRRRRDL